MYLDIHTREGLAEHEPAIAELFAACFGRELSLPEWRWFYLDNPLGAAYVALHYEGARLLGHYAVVPTQFMCNGTPFLAYRSMTTMVHPDVKVPGLFLTLAKRVNAQLLADNASLVYGFPNKNSALGFRRFLNWTLPPADPVVDLSGAEMLADPALLAALTARAEIEWDSGDPLQAAWRNSRPGAHSTAAPGLVVKPFDGVLNVLHIGAEGAASIVPDATYRLMLPADFRPEAMQPRARFHYQFGFRVIDPQYEGRAFRRELIMSDVF